MSNKRAICKGCAPHPRHNGKCTFCNCDLHTPTTHHMRLELQKYGWTPIRKRGEPVYWRDPLKCESGYRTEGAYEMLTKRLRSGVTQKIS